MTDRTVIRLRLHQRQQAVRTAATKTRAARVIPAMAPPERGKRETKEEEELMVGDAVKGKVALTSAVYWSL